MSVVYIFVSFIIECIYLCLGVLSCYLFSASFPLFYVSKYTIIHYCVWDAILFSDYIIIIIVILYMRIFTINWQKPEEIVRNVVS